MALLLSLLIAGDSIAAPQHASLQPYVYLPRVQQSGMCVITAPEERPLVLPSQPLAYIHSGDIWLFRASTGRMEQLTQAGHVQAFTWSPDATRIAFSDNESLAINVLRLADHHVTTLISWNDGHHPSSLAWAPDGQRIAFDLSFYDGMQLSSSVMIMQADGTHVQQLSSIDYDHSPVWSPDGRQIAFVSNYIGNDPNWPLARLYVMQADGSNPTPLPDVGQTSSSSLGWSPDGTWLAFNGTCSTGPRATATDHTELFMIAPDGSGKTRLTFTLFDVGVGMGQWSPDGRLIAYTQQVHNINAAIFAIAVDGSGEQQLPISGLQPAWAPR